MFRELTAGKGAVRDTLRKYLDSVPGTGTVK